MNLINGRTAFVAVVYNAIWFETNAAASLTKAGISKDDIFLFDNSDKEEFIEANSKCMLARYMGFGKNVGLSKAYNLSVSKIRKLTEYSEIVFMDADTSFPASYFTFVGKNHDINKVWLVDWDKPGKVDEWRGQWAQAVNQYFELKKMPDRISEKTLKEQGIELPATKHVGVNNQAEERAEYNELVKEQGADVKIMDRLVWHREVPHPENFSKPGF